MNKLERKILAFPPVSKLLHYSKRISLPGLDGIPVYDVMSFFITQAKKIGFSERAAAISFNIIMAMPGVLIFLFTLVPFLPDAVHFHDELHILLNDLIKNDKLQNMLSNIIEDFFNNERSGLLWFSVLFIIFFSSNAMMGIMHTFDRSYFEERSSRFMAKRWTAFKLTSLLIFLFLSSMLALATQGGIKSFILQKLGWDNPLVQTAIDYSRWIIFFLLTFFSVAVIYRYGPAVKVKWSLRSPGAVLATVLMILVSWGFSVWVNNFSNYNKIYGSIGTVIILMNIVYMNALILIIGFEINVSITAIKAQSKKRIEQEEDLGQYISD